jgi:hypothetical protein
MTDHDHLGPWTVLVLTCIVAFTALVFALLDADHGDNVTARLDAIETRIATPATPTLIETIATRVAALEAAK